MTPHRTDTRWTDHKMLGAIVRSVWQWQMVVAFSAVAVAVGIALLDPHLYAHGAFLAGITLIAAITAATLTIRWTGRRTLAAVAPLADTVAIGLLAIPDATLGYLWVVPVAWIATYFTTIAIFGALAIVLGMQVARWWVPGSSETSPLEIIIVLLALGFLGIAMNQGARRTRAFRRLVHRQTAQLDRAVARSAAYEERTLALFDSISAALARVDGSGEITLTNSAYRSLYGYRDTDYWHPARSVEYDSFRGNALPREATSLARAARGERVENEVIWLYDAAGQWRALSMSIRGRDTAGEMAGGASIIQLDDVTAAEFEARQARSATSAVSHELRNPLTVIVGHTDMLLEDDTLTPAQREHARLIEGAADRMIRLTSSLLGSHRGTEGVNSFDLRDLAAAAVDAFAPAAIAAEIDCALDGDDPLPVAADGFRLRQVLDNLLSNAIKYTPRGGAVRVSAHRDGEHAVLTVRDSGIGIAPADVANVFTPYFRAQTAVASGIGGTGLGMSIAHSIVEEEGGTLDLESALGSGTSVTLRLPLVPDSSATTGAERAVDPPESTP